MNTGFDLENRVLFSGTIATIKANLLRSRDAKPRVSGAANARDSLAAEG
jgi:hypothetical protein